VLPAFAKSSRPKRRGRVDERKVWDASLRPRPASRREDGRRLRVHRVQGSGAQGHDGARLQEVELSVEIRTASTGRTRVETIPRGSALQDVQNPELFGPKIEGGDGSVEFPARSADERNARPVLLCPGRLADEHHARGETATIDDGLGPDCTEGAQLARPDRSAQPIPRGPFGRTQ